MKKLGLVVLSVGLMVGTVSFSALACSPGPENSYTPNARYSYQYETQYAPNAHYPYQYQTQNDPMLVISLDMKM